MKKIMMFLLATILFMLPAQTVMASEISDTNKGHGKVLAA